MYKLSNYRDLYKTQIAIWADRIGTEDQVALALALVRANDCPCIVAAHLVGETYGFSDPLNKWIQKLKEFSSTNSIKDENEN